MPRLAWRVTGIALGALGAIVLTGCGSSHMSAPGSPTSAANPTVAAANSADVAFMQSLTGIGDDTVALAGLVPGRTGHPALAALVPVIAGRSADLALMRDWMSGRTPAVAATPARMSAQMLQTMAGMRGTSFDDEWLERMGTNFTIAIADCRDELSHGRNPAARAFASSWMGWMSTELAQLRTWHGAWMHDTRFPGAVPGRTDAPRSVPPMPRPTSIPAWMPMTTRPGTMPVPHMTGAPHVTGTHDMSPHHSQPPMMSTR